MKRIRGWLFRLVGLFSQSRCERELAAELESHLQMHIDDNLRAGMAPEEARRQALIKLGGIEQTKERYRDGWGIAALETLVQDLRFGFRQLRRNPGFTAVAVVTLALGIGATSAIFSLVNASLLHPLPFRDAGRLVTRWGTMTHFNYTGPMAICGRDYSAWRDQNHVFEGIAAFSGETSNLTGAGDPVRLDRAQVTAGYFSVLGVKPAFGRAFQPAEDTPGNDHEVVLSNKLWASRFGSSHSVVGKSIILDGEPYAVVGVMPAGFDFPNQAQIWTPVPLTQDCSNATMLLIARLKPGVRLDHARSEVAVIDARLDRQHRGSQGDQLTLVPLAQAMGYQLRREIIILMGAVSFLLLIACANVANLLLARGATRQREMALRNVLGAGRRRIMAQVLTESLLLAAIGGSLGLAVANWGHRFLVSSFIPPNNAFSASVAARVGSLGIDRWVLIFTLVVTCLTGIIFGLAPAIKVSKPDLQSTLKESGRNILARRGRVRDAFIVAEIAISLVLLAGGGLLGRTLVRLMSVDPGFSPKKVLTMAVELAETRYHNRAQMIAFERTALARLQALPGVTAAGGVFGLPFSAEGVYGDITIQGSSAQPGVIPAKVVVAGDYFRALGIPLIQGRLFTADDTRNARCVAIVSKGLARRLWPSASAVGKGLKPGFSQNSWYTVVGVVGDVKMTSLSEQPPPVLYLAYEQAPVPFLMRDLTLVIRTASSPASIAAEARRAINSVDPGLAVFDVAAMEQLVHRSAAGSQLDAVLLAIFATLALVLAGVGIYGVMSYAVGRQTHEIGIRMALGARNSNILRMVLGDGLRLIVVGLAVGLLGALALTRLLSGLLYGVEPADPVTFVAVSLLLASVALLACYVPAKRATKVDPMVALRHE